MIVSRNVFKLPGHASVSLKHGQFHLILSAYAGAEPKALRQLHCHVENVIRLLQSLSISKDSGRNFG